MPVRIVKRNEIDWIYTDFIGLMHSIGLWRKFHPRIQRELTGLSYSITIKERREEMFSSTDVVVFFVIAFFCIFLAFLPFWNYLM